MITCQESPSVYVSLLNLTILDTVFQAKTTLVSKGIQLTNPLYRFSIIFQLPGMDESGTQNQTLRNKSQRASKMNDTFALWNQIPRKKNNQHPSHTQEQEPTKFITLNQIPITDHSMQKVRKNDVKGMTLDEYFRAKSQIGLDLEVNKINQEDQEDLRRYCDQQFEVQQKRVPAKQYAKNVQTPEFTHVKHPKQKLVKKKTNGNCKNPLRTNKLKTEISEPPPINKSKCRSIHKKHLVTSTNQEDQHIPMLQTFCNTNLKARSENQPKVSKKVRVLDKVGQQKQRLANIQANDMSFVTKHANKFHINKDLCQQLIFQELRC